MLPSRLDRITYCATSATGTACLKDHFDWTGGGYEMKEDTIPSARTATSFLPGSIAIGQGTDGNLRRVGQFVDLNGDAASTLFKARVGEPARLDQQWKRVDSAQRPRSSPESG